MARTWAMSFWLVALTVVGRLGTAAREESGGVTQAGRRSIPVLVTDERLQDRLRRDYVYEIDLAPGRADLAVALRDELGGETSYLTAVAGEDSG